MDITYATGAEPNAGVSGYVEFYGHHATAGGWFFSGWTTKTADLADRLKYVSAFFTDELVTGPVSWLLFEREDLEDAGIGFLIFIQSDITLIDQLICVQIDVGQTEQKIYPVVDALSLPEIELTPLLKYVIAKAANTPRQFDMERLLAGTNEPATFIEPCIHEAAPADVIGFLERVDTQGIHGWALDRKTPNVPLVLAVLIDGRLAGRAVCDISRPDVPSVGQPTELVGFMFALPASALNGRAHAISLRTEAGETVELSTIDGMKQTEWHFHFRGASPRAEGFLGFIERISEDGIAGWIVNKLIDDIVTIRLVVDNQVTAVITCNDHRPDVQRSEGTRPNVGFSVDIPARYYDENSHEFYFIAENGCVIELSTTAGLREHFWELRLQRYTVIGRIDGTRDGAIRGWAVLYDKRLGKKIGSQEIVIRSHDQLIGQVTANSFRPDVAAAFDCGMDCGFVYVPRPEVVMGRTLNLTFTIVPYGLDVPGSPIKYDFLDSQSYRLLADLLDKTEELFAQVWQIRSTIKDLIPSGIYNLENYHEWAIRYQSALAALDVQRDLFDGIATEIISGMPLVSVICPAYRPRLKDFRAAVESVRAQSYQNWELIIVDDASLSPELAALIEDFCASDIRIKSVILSQNSGISFATNEAIAVSSGDYIALFDHDDLLVSKALEVMIAYALRTGAKMLYSDEDKIDDLGRFSEVHLKPSWNYRLLLSQNYICHLLFIERQHLLATGPLRSKYDGAQDHDLILRLTEALDRNEIVHVPEILYHWRKTPTSTAASGGAKEYAIGAGHNCISDHLKRKGIEAKVKSQLKMTCYEIDWKLASQPSVCIIIPYREHIDLTRQCLTSLFEHTDYENFEVILADNWSTSGEASEFAASWANHGRVKHFRIPEKFNYSRINNLAARETAAEFLLFMNNDVVLFSDEWLKVLVGELVVDQTVAIAGSKLLYPNGLVQHGGVVLGVGGIADHSFRMLGAHEPGYAARALCAQEVSAVTAACLLCRHSVFDEVGGFDEVQLAVTYNDVDLCLRVGEAGYKIIWNPNSIAEHHESISRGSDLVPDQQARFFHEQSVMMDRWRNVIEDDPFYNPHFSRRSGIFSDLGEPKPKAHREQSTSNEISRYQVS